MADDIDHITRPNTTMSKSGNYMSPSDASRVQSAEARAGSGGVSSGGFAARAQSASAGHANAGGGGVESLEAGEVKLQVAMEGEARVAGVVVGEVRAEAEAVRSRSVYDRSRRGRHTRCYYTICFEVLMHARCCKLNDSSFFIADHYSMHVLVPYIEGTGDNGIKCKRIP